jgi:hypothetical protein
MELREATPADAERLGRAVIDGLEDYPSFAPPEWRAPPVSQEVEELRELLADDRVWCVLGEDDGRLAGQVTVLPAAIGPRLVTDPGLAHFSNLFVERDFWGTYEREGRVAAGEPFFDPAPGLEILEYRRRL